MINYFSGEYRFLSNFYPSDIEWKGLKYKSAEAAFQASKTMDNNIRTKFRYLNPSEAKRLGRKIDLRPDWEDVKIEIMTKIVRIKFSDPYLRTKLLETEDKELIEGNGWSDTFWGVSSETGLGENHLGKILMKIRDEIRMEDQNV